MPHYSRQRSRSRSPSPRREDTIHEEELDEFGRVKQRRSNFGGGRRRVHSHNRSNEDDEHSDGDEQQDRQKGDHPQRRRNHSRSPSIESYDNDNDDEHYRYSSDDSHSSMDSRYSNHHHRRRYQSRRESSVSPSRHHHHDKSRYHGRRNYSDTDGNDQAQNKIYIGDLATGTASTELEQAFARFGHIKHIKLIEGKEYGFITFEDSSSAQEAISTMDGTFIGSQKIRVNRAKTMDRSRYGTSTWMDEDGEKSHSASTRHYRAPPSHALDPPPAQRTLTSYEDLL